MSRQTDFPAAGLWTEILEPRAMFSTSEYSEVDLVSDVAHTAAITGSSLVNTWGMAVIANGILVADNGTGLATMYTGIPTRRGPAIHVPDPTNVNGTPTGVVANTDSSLFLIPGTAKSAQYIFVTEGGAIDAYNSTLN